MSTPSSLKAAYNQLWLKNINSSVILLYSSNLFFCQMQHYGPTNPAPHMSLHLKLAINNHRGLNEFSISIYCNNTLLGSHTMTFFFLLEQFVFVHVCRFYLTYLIFYEDNDFTVWIRGAGVPGADGLKNFDDFTGLWTAASDSSDCQSEISASHCI